MNGIGPFLRAIRNRETQDRELEDAQAILHAVRHMTKNGYFAGSFKEEQISRAIQAIQRVRDGVG